MRVRRENLVGAIAAAEKDASFRDDSPRQIIVEGVEISPAAPKEEPHVLSLAALLHSFGEMMEMRGGYLIRGDLSSSPIVTQ